MSIPELNPGAAKPGITVIVDKGIEDLIPDFLNNRRRELAELQSAHAAGDFDELKNLGHRMRGVGAPFGFDHISELGKLIQRDASEQRGAGMAGYLADYADYLERVRITYAG